MAQWLGFGIFHGWAWVQFLVGDPRSYKMQGMAKKKITKAVSLYDRIFEKERKEKKSTFTTLPNPTRVAFWLVAFQVFLK